MTLLGCATTTPVTKTESADAPVVENSKKVERPTPLEKKPLSRIAGSADIPTEGQYRGAVYYLYGAEHLNLENYYFDIPVVYNEAVKKWMDYFLNKGRPFFERYAERAGRYAPVLGKILEENGMPRDLIFLAMAESGFQNNAKSWARAVGPWQFMPYTGKKYGLEINWFVDERRDPIKATIAAAKYLKKLYEEFGAWEIAAAAYNAGEGKLSRAIKKYQTDNFWHLTTGRYLKSETKNYVPKIMALAIIGKNLKSFGFEEIDFHEELDFDEVEIPAFTDVAALVEAIGTDAEEVRRLNPELLRWFTPPDIQKYILRVPVGDREKWEYCCKEQSFVASLFQEYEVPKKGTTLAEIGKKFRVDPKVMMLVNKEVSLHDRLGAGTKVYLPFRQGQNPKDAMYADLYEQPRGRALRNHRYRALLKSAKARGKKISNPREFYTVEKGDTIWDVSKKTGVPMETLIKSNEQILNDRMIRAGDRLNIR